MKHLILTPASFVTTAVDPSGYPTVRNKTGEIRPEIAVAGRSNVGKSSLLNHLFQTKSLVKTSSTPGKTQTLNFFTAGQEILFVDLPGYGYANVPARVKKKWGPMIQAYLESRQPLQLILFLLDIRRIPSEEDLKFFDWVLFHKKAVILVLTKVDKVKENEKKLFTERILKALPAQNLYYVHYSILNQNGRDALMKLIHEALFE